MTTRRTFLAAGGAAAAVLASPATAALSTADRPPGRVVRLPRRFFPKEVDVNPALPAGELHVTPEDHFLYWTLGNGRAIRYGIALGAAGRNFKGVATIARKAEWPSWRPTRNMIRLEPHIYGKYRDGLPGGHPMNPLGSRALYMYQGGRDTFYRVHGTPQPWTIGQSFSSGCVRLVNQHIEHLYAQVPVGTRIVVH